MTPKQSYHQIDEKFHMQINASKVKGDVIIDCSLLFYLFMQFLRQEENETIVAGRSKEIANVMDMVRYHVHVLYLIYLISFVYFLFLYYHFF